MHFWYNLTMENIAMNESNYSSTNRNNYSAFQLILPLDLEKKIEKEDPVYSFLEVMEGVNWSKYLCKPSNKGREEYDPFKMIRVILFAFMNQIYSLRKIAQACKTDIRFMFLMGEEKPSHMAFQRFITHYLKEDIRDIFRDIFDSICTLDSVNTDTVYIDGTKLEANANKFSFIWKKTALKTRDKTFNRINESVVKLGEDIHVEKKEEWTPEELDEILEQLSTKAKEGGILFIYGRGKRKTEIQRKYDELSKLKDTLKSCLERIEVCGSHRNSCSKTDHDATMMHMKEDYYMKTGIFKAGYNAQLAVSDEYIQYVAVYQDRADQKTLIKLLEEMKEQYHRNPKVVVADAGYGSYDNYLYCLQHGMEAYIKYTMYSKEKESKYQKEKFKKANWKKNEDGEYVCPAGHTFHYVNESVDKRSVYLRINQSHSCGKCEGCEYKSECTKSKGNRVITVNPILEEFESTAKAKLDSEEGIQHRVRRSIQTEGAFGVIKEDYGYDRFHRRKLENVRMELMLVCIGFNLLKYHNKKRRKKAQA